MSTLASNPSQVLLSRNPRSPAHPQLAPTWTSRHPPTPAALAWGSSTDDLGHVRAYSGSLPPSDQSGVLHSEAVEEEEEVEEEVIDVHPTFRKEATLPGRIKVIVGRYEFWCHKEVLWFACPFFQDVLQGSWAETNHTHLTETSPSPLPSHRNSFIAESTVAETDTDPEMLHHSRTLPSLQEDFSPISDPPRSMERREELTRTVEDDEDYEEGQAQTSSVYLDAVEDGMSVADILRELRELPDMPNSAQALHILDPETVGPSSEVPILGEIVLPLPPPVGPISPTSAHTTDMPSPHVPSSIPTTRPPSIPSRTSRRRSSARPSFSSGIRPPSVSRLRASAARATRDHDDRVDAVVQLHEESAAAFQDFLFWAYPHLECKVTWTNVENLLALACKLIVPALQKLCEHFLLTHASGRPVMALALAEQHNHAELFKEASRFVLDQPTWNSEEMEDLSDHTRLRLSHRRTWFVERLLKLYSIDVRKEYTCRPECPDPARCQFYLDEKWKQAQSAVLRYGPPQPSVAFKCLRQLETFPTYPSLVMPHPLCQSAAKSWVMLLYDRMFQLKTIASPLIAGTEKYWLFITLH